MEALNSSRNIPIWWDQSIWANNHSFKWTIHSQSYFQEVLKRLITEIIWLKNEKKIAVVFLLLLRKVSQRHYRLKPEPIVRYNQTRPYW